MLTNDTGSDNGCLNYQTNRNQTHAFAGWERLSADARGRIAARFWSKVARTSDSDACWLWTAGTKAGKFDYGQFTFTVDGTQVHTGSNRMAWVLTHGDIPSDLSVLHRCDVPRCCNPSHLFIGTPADNINDARAKKRLVDGRGARKLSDEAYAEILSTSGYGTGKALAKKFGVTHIQISRIRNGHSGSTFHATTKGNNAASASVEHQQTETHR